MSRIKSHIINYVFGKSMDGDIENILKPSKVYALAAKSPPIKLTSRSKIDLPWSKIHIDFPGPLDGFYLLMVVNSFSKYPEIFRYKISTTEVVTSFLYELFAWFGVEDCIVSDNGS